MLLAVGAELVLVGDDTDDAVRRALAASIVEVDRLIERVVAREEFRRERLVDDSDARVVGACFVTRERAPLDDANAESFEIRVAGPSPIGCGHRPLWECT